MKVRSKEDLDIKIQQFKKDYDMLKERHDAEINEIKQEAIFDDIQGLKYQEFIDERGNINSFSVDNLYNEERVKAYYLSAQSLCQAYKDTGFFNVSFYDVTKCLGDDDISKLNSISKKIEKWKLLVKFLDKIQTEFEQGVIDLYDKNNYVNLLKGDEENQYIIDAFQKIGKTGIEEAQYKKGLIDKAIKQYEKEQAEILRFSPNVLKDIKEEFEMNVYINKNEIKGRLQAIYDEHNIKYKVTQNTIENYYTTDNSGSIKGGSYKLTAFKFD